MISATETRPKPAAPNPTIASGLQFEHRLRGVGEPERSAK